MNLIKTSRTAVIVIPTYNEGENISALIDKIFWIAEMVVSKWSVRILIVDGRSTDDTVRRVKEKIESSSDLHLIVEEKKEGIGAAYLKGFAYAIDNLRADVVLEFDGDFQHPPEVIPSMLNKIDEGYDYVIGSRFSNGGADLRKGSLIRRLLSSAGGYLARLILFFPGRYFHLVTDPTSGLRATRVAGFLDKLDLNAEHLYSKKFGYKIELLSRIIRLNPKYAEVALQFEDRHGGSSKIESGTAWEILITSIRSRLSTYQKGNKGGKIKE